MMVEKQILPQPTSMSRMRLDDAIPIHVRALLDKASQLSDHFARSSCGDGLAVIVRYKQKWQSIFSDIKEPWPKVVARLTNGASKHASGLINADSSGRFEQHTPSNSSYVFVLEDPSQTTENALDHLELQLINKTAQLQKSQKLLDQERRNHQAQLKSQADSDQKRFVALNQMAVHATKVAHTKLRGQIDTLEQQLTEAQSTLQAERAKQRSYATHILQLRARIAERDDCIHNLRTFLREQRVERSGFAQQDELNRLRNQLSARAEVCMIAFDPERDITFPDVSYIGSQSEEEAIQQTSIPNSPVPGAGLSPAHDHPPQTWSTVHDTRTREQRSNSVEYLAQTTSLSHSPVAARSCPPDPGSKQAMMVASGSRNNTSRPTPVHRSESGPSGDQLHSANHREQSSDRLLELVGGVLEGGTASGDLHGESPEDPQLDATSVQDPSPPLAQCLGGHWALQSDFIRARKVSHAQATKYCKACREYKKRHSSRKKRDV